MNACMMNITDVHSHGEAKCGRAVVSGSPAEISRLAASWPSPFSVGIHPWATRDITFREITDELALLERLASLPEVVAVGEAGLDRLKGGDMTIQAEIFKEQVRISERVAKPLVLHVVRSGHLVMALCREMERELNGLRQPWIWHGFRGGTVEAGQFLNLRNENYISLGLRFNTATARSVSTGRLLVETDDCAADIENVVGEVARARGVDADALRQQVCANLGRIFTGSETEWARAL